MQSIKFDALSALKRDIEGLAETMKERRRELHEELAEEMQEEVAAQIARRASHSTGDLAGWQEPHVGSAGGYAAVRPAVGNEVKQKKGGGEISYPIGYITNSIENGHAVPRPRKNRKYYKARIVKSYVTGLYFYRSLQDSGRVEKLAIDGVNRLADEIEKKLGGG